MIDLIKSIEEHRAERLAIMQESSVEDPVIASEDDLRKHEVTSVIRQYFPDRFKVKEYLRLVEKHRGKKAAETLRQDLLVAWERKRLEIAGQA